MPLVMEGSPNWWCTPTGTESSRKPKRAMAVILVLAYAAAPSLLYFCAIVAAAGFAEVVAPIGAGLSGVKRGAPLPGFFVASKRAGV